MFSICSLSKWIKWSLLLYVSHLIRKQWYISLETNFINKIPHAGERQSSTNKANGCIFDIFDYDSISLISNIWEKRKKKGFSNFAVSRSFSLSFSNAEAASYYKLFQLNWMSAIYRLHDKVKSYIKKDVFLLKLEHLLIIKQYPANLA